MFLSQTFDQSWFVCTSPGVWSPSKQTKKNQSCQKRFERKKKADVCVSSGLKITLVSTQNYTVICMILISTTTNQKAYKPLDKNIHMLLF